VRNGNALGQQLGFLSLAARLDEDRQRAAPSGRGRLHQLHLVVAVLLAGALQQALRAADRQRRARSGSRLPGSASTAAACGARRACSGYRTGSRPAERSPWQPRFSCGRVVGREASPWVVCAIDENRSLARHAIAEKCQKPTRHAHAKPDRSACRHGDRLPAQAASSPSHEAQLHEPACGPCPPPTHSARCSSARRACNCCAAPAAWP